MEEQADDLISKSLTYNLVDQDEYPHIVEIENHCVEMLSNLYHAPEPGVGTSTVGSSEAMMLTGLAMKWRWRQHAIARISQGFLISSWVKMFRYVGKVCQIF